MRILHTRARRLGPLASPVALHPLPVLHASACRVCIHALFSSRGPAGPHIRCTHLLSTRQEATKFNQALSFDTSNVRDMSFMFAHALAFNQTLSFDTSNVTDMQFMFTSCKGSYYDHCEVFGASAFISEISKTFVKISKTFAEIMLGAGGYI